VVRERKRKDVVNIDFGAWIFSNFRRRILCCLPCRVPTTESGAEFCSRHGIRFSNTCFFSIVATFASVGMSRAVAGLTKWPLVLGVQSAVNRLRIEALLPKMSLEFWYVAKLDYRSFYLLI